MKKMVSVMICALIIMGSVSIIIGFTGDLGATPSVVINEVCNHNGTIGVENRYAGEDYIELYNTTDEVICLDGWWLSDDKAEPMKERISEKYLEPESYAVFFANGASDGDRSLGFKLSKNGESVFLSDPAGKVVDRIYVPETEVDTVYARKNDGENVWQRMEASMGSSNHQAAEIRKATLEKPVFSHKSGVYEDSFVLTMKAGFGQKIHYTTDGSMPTKNSIQYKNGIMLSNRSMEENVINGVRNVVPDWKDYELKEEKADKGTVIRAVAIDRRGNVSEVVTETYIVGLPKYQTGKVMSIIAEPEKLFGPEGILVTGDTYDEWYLTDSSSKDGVFENTWATNYELTNFWQRGRATEILGTIQFFENGERILDQKAGIRVQGNYTRTLSPKSLQLFSRKTYSESGIFNAQLLDGVDSKAVYVTTFPEKAYFLGFAEGRSLSTQKYEVCPVFVNGEYWYTAILMEKYDEQYFAQHFGIDAANILYLKDREPVWGEENFYLFDNMYNMLKDDTIEDSDKFAMLYKEIDVQSFIDWMCFNLYLCNDDISTEKNSVMWRSIEKGESICEDGKWRWMLYDVDHCVISEMVESENFSDFQIAATNRFYKILKKDDKFCERMISTALDMMNTAFSAENVEKVLGEWGLDLTYYDSFFLKRPQHMIQSLVNEFGLSETMGELTVSVNDVAGGSIEINTITPDLSSGSWSGEYFTDCPVKLTAVPAEGYQFVGWSGSTESTEKHIEINVLETGTDVIAIFEKE